MRVVSAMLIPYVLYVEQVIFFKYAKELRMAKSEVRIQYTLPLNEIRMQHHVNARDRAMEAFILDRFIQGNISAVRVARLLNISRENLSDLIYKMKPEPPLLARSARQKS